MALFDKDIEHQFYTEYWFRTKQSIEVQKHILEMFEEFQTERQQKRRDDREAAPLQTLASDYKSDKDSISTWLPDTCEWFFFKDKRFLDWRDKQNSSLLWIFANSARGKSVLSRRLIDGHRLCTNSMTSTICYLFSKMARSSVRKDRMQLVPYFTSYLKRNPALLFSLMH